MIRRQHDHHCILVVHDVLQRIIQVQMPRIVIGCERGCCRRVIDTSGMDFQAYCDAAAMNDFARAVRTERGLPVAMGSEARN